MAVQSRPVRKRTSVVAATRRGALVGGAIALLPCLLFAVLGVIFVDWLGSLLAIWAESEVWIRTYYVGVTTNLADLLGVDGVEASLRYWRARPALTFAVLFLVPWLATILFSALIGMLVGAVVKATSPADG